MATESTTYDCKREGTPDLRILHFNDVYHIEPGSKEPCGGIARFQTLCNHYRSDDRFKGQPELLTFFSGDAFNPSLESSITKGSHMVPVLNQIGTTAACVGNHDLDFGVKQFRHLASRCTFPWLLANVLDPALGENVPLGNALRTTMITSSNGIKIGLIGLVEREWLDTINSLPPNLIYKSASATAAELIPALRAQGAELVIALSHQREPNDNKLAENTPAGLIDVVLGGHDHYYKHQLLNGTHVLRSGSDFKQLSYLQLWRSATDRGKWDVSIARADVTRALAPDPGAAKLAQELSTKLSAKLDRHVGVTAAPLDARFTTVRARESNLGNFVADMMRLYHGGDCAAMAAGTIRGDVVYPPGPLRMRDIVDCFPFEDPVVVIRVSGRALLEALENGVSQYPALEGRFLQVSGIRFAFDPRRPSGSRLEAAGVQVAGAPIDLERKYVLVTRDYMARGKDGFASLRTQEAGGEAEVVVGEEEGILISMMLRQYFLGLKTVGRWRRWGKSMGAHWERVSEGLHGVHPVREAAAAAGRRGQEGDVAEGEDDSEDTDGEPDLPGADDGEEGGRQSRSFFSEREMHVMRHYARRWREKAGVRREADLADVPPAGELRVDWTRGIEPKVEGRIVILGQA